MPTTPSYYMVGGGIAALAAAAYLIRDADVPGHAIRILDDQPAPGGALDGTGDTRSGFLTRGGRMFEPCYLNTFDLLDGIPSTENPAVSVKDDILAFNREVKAASNCRLISDGQKADFEHLGLSASDILALNRLLLTRERVLGDRTIGACFDRAFFDSNFWIMWSTMFSFQPWHSAVEMRRYMQRFVHLLPGFTRIKGILRTRYNQYDSLIDPVWRWLAARGVTVSAGSVVTGLEFDGTGRNVSAVRLGTGERIGVAPQDRVLVTLGSMTDGATYGDNSTAPAPDPGPCPSWRLWRDLAREHPGFGRPDAFAGDPGRTTWSSFTVTMADDRFAAHVGAFTGNRTGTGGLVTIRDSNWLLSFVMFNQPHFRSQAPGSVVFWGYGLRGDRNGDFIGKPMWQATGEEILDELCGHLGLGPEQRNWFAGALVRSARMPFITSQFMPRNPGDRPRTQPEPGANYALMGQFVELPRDTVFTVEYSVRSARAAVQALTGHGGPIPVARTDRNPRVLLRAAKVLTAG